MNYKSNEFEDWCSQIALQPYWIRLIVGVLMSWTVLPFALIIMTFFLPVVMILTTFFMGLMIFFGPILSTVYAIRGDFFKLISESEEEE